MPRKVKIILNPMADMGNAWRVARDLRSITEQHGGVDVKGFCVRFEDAFVDFSFGGDDCVFDHPVGHVDRCREGQ